MLQVAFTSLALLASSALPNSPVTLTVELPSGVLLSRFAPNQLTLSAGGHTQTLRPVGTPNRHADYADYFGTLEPLRFRLPLNDQAGKMLGQGTLSAQLFVCDKTARLCAMRTFKMQVTLGKTLRLTEAQLQPACLSSTQATTAAGTDANHNGIRDEVEALIKNDPDFQQSPRQTAYAMKLAGLMQFEIEQINLTKPKALAKAQETTYIMGCFMDASTPEVAVTTVPKLIAATFNTPIRIQKEREFSNMVNGAAINSTNPETCK